mgnify:FL=1
MTATRPRVLLVDEDPVSRLAIDRQLDTIGWEAYCAGSGFDALRTIGLRLPFEALLVSVRLPDMFGQTVAAAAAQIIPSAQLIFLVTEPPVVTLGAPFLVKPFSTSALAAALQPR